MRRSIIWILVLLFVATAISYSFAQTIEVGIFLHTKDEPRWIQDEARFNDALKTAVTVPKFSSVKVLLPEKKKMLKH